MEYKRMIFSFLLFIVVFLHAGTCWRGPPKDSFLCYHCGSETDTGIDFPCEKFKPDPMFEGPCGTDNFCVKTVTRSGHTVRGCAMKTTIDSDYEHETGCLFINNKKMTDIEITCFCEDPLCNGTSFFTYKNILILNLISLMVLKLIL